MNIINLSLYSKGNIISKLMINTKTKTFLNIPETINGLGRSKLLNVLMRHFTCCTEDK